jgi:hypothetical protein
MATATYTSTVFKHNAAKNIHIGTQTVSGQLAWGATSTVGDVGFLARVPHGAKIVDFIEYHTTGATAQALSFGFDRGVVAGGAGNASVLLGSAAQATANRVGAGLFTDAVGGNAPLQLSLSDTDPNRYAILTAKIESGTTTTSLFVNFILSYRMDGPDRT